MAACAAAALAWAPALAVADAGAGSDAGSTHAGSTHAGSTHADSTHADSTHADAAREGRRVHAFAESSFLSGGSLYGPRTFDSWEFGGRIAYDAGALVRVTDDGAWSAGAGLQLTFAGDGARLSLLPRARRHLGGSTSVDLWGGVTLLQEAQLDRAGVLDPGLVAGAALTWRWVSLKVQAHHTRFGEQVLPRPEGDVIRPAGDDLSVYAGVSITGKPGWVLVGLQAIGYLVAVAYGSASS